VIYQVYPRSFQDSNGDGIGDLNGIAARLDHLVSLGVAAMWISPIFPSPMADFGYDVADYCAVDASFGTLADLERLIAAAHRRGIKVILDYVPNHTSDQHPWFIESRRSRASDKRDWYVWHDGRDGGPPNNWLSEFGGSAWSFDEASGQYYYHSYLREQPDLNWRNPAVQAAMLDVLRFWLERGIDGFRVDAIHHLFEDPSFTDNPLNARWRPGMPPSLRLTRTYTVDQPEVHEAIRTMRQLAERYDGDRVLIGEAYLPIDRLMLYYGADLGGFHLPFNFHLLTTPWRAAEIAALIAAYERALPPGAWPNWVLGNHDRSRIASRLGPAQARVAAMLLLTLRGTPTIYQGEEIGMQDVAIPAACVQDPLERNVPGLGLGRDPARTPMQWSAERHAGFSSAAPWLLLAADAEQHNVAAEERDPRSMLALYRSLIRLRQGSAALIAGAYREIGSADGVLVFERATATERYVVALNLESRAKSLALEEGGLEICLSTHLDCASGPADRQLRLRADEGVILRPAPATVTAPAS
jgi:alpha-glucosidase